MAYKWMSIAVAAGFSEADKARENISKEMTQEQIAEAQKLSREWKPKKETSN